MVVQTKGSARCGSTPLYLLTDGSPVALARLFLIEKAIDKDAVQAGMPLPDAYGIVIDERVIEYP